MIGEEEAARCGVIWLPSDFKKRNGFLRSCELTQQYGMYRQDYCGCIYSLRKGTGHIPADAPENASQPSRSSSMTSE